MSRITVSVCKRFKGWVCVIVGPHDTFAVAETRTGAVLGAVRMFREAMRSWRETLRWEEEQERQREERQEALLAEERDAWQYVRDDD